MNPPFQYSIVIPARNEKAGLSNLLPRLTNYFPDTEIIVVNDGGDTETIALCERYGCLCISHPIALGNGAAIKTGARAASKEVIVFMDADGQHQPEDIANLIDKLNAGHDMVVGARSRESQAGWHRASANGLYNKLASWMVGHKVMDLTSGFRAVRAEKFRQFLYLLPNGFSYPTTITMCFFRAGYAVGYVPIYAPKRIGKSHLRIWRDGMRFMLIMFRIATLYSPLKLFFPISLAFFVCGTVYSAYTLNEFHRFTNMSALLFITAILVFLIGLVSEQITMLNYRDSDSK
jgi:glycosyltransferase involved in cell wall biosynthesis